MDFNHFLMSEHFYGLDRPMQEQILGDLVSGSMDVEEVLFVNKDAVSGKPLGPLEAIKKR